MADQKALEQKYAPVGQTVADFSEYGAKFEGIFMEGEKLILKASVPSKVVLNRVWDATKQVDANYQDFEPRLTVTGGDAQPYTIKAGDNLSKIAEKFYGHANKYETIAQANGISNPDKIQVGQQINIPPLS
ncbi:MAG TPA: LysM peptidoglycan-binding domain-containing protein [Acidobacteriaceae bacterium]|jgi:nucleoid-associated protein YgaU|nr:LysM peptidoglycan-binding domain-containing protein [Acidobacteriaceae bacterium]